MRIRSRTLTLLAVPALARINRMDYGVSWNRAAEGGGLTLGDEVTISIAIEAVEQGAS